MSRPPRHRGRTRVERYTGAERRRKRKKRRKRRRRRRRHREKEARGRACEKESARPGEEEARPLRPLSSFEVHERLRRTKRRRAGYSLPFLLSRGVLPFPVEARNGEPLHGPFTITIIVDGDRQKERRADARQRVGKKRTPLSSPLPPPFPWSPLEGNVVECREAPGDRRF